MPERIWILSFSNNHRYCRHVNYSQRSVLRFPPQLSDSSGSNSFTTGWLPIYCPIHVNTIPDHDSWPTNQYNKTHTPPPPSTLTSVSLLKLLLLENRFKHIVSIFKLCVVSIPYNYFRFLELNLRYPRISLACLFRWPLIQRPPPPPRFAMHKTRDPDATTYHTRALLLSPDSPLRVCTSSSHHHHQ